MAAETPIHVLAVDDDADTLANLRDILEMDHYQVDTAGTVAEALNRDNWPVYAAIILDRQLPDGTAEEVLPRLKQLAPAAAVIIVTGYADLQGTILALRLGAADYILKPIKAEELRARLSHIAERKRAEEKLREAQQRALQAERLAAIGQTIAGLAHESRNALQRIQSSLELLNLELQDQPKALEYVDNIQKAQEHLHRLYDQLRRYAAPVVLNCESCHLGDILQESWFHLHALRKGRVVHFREEADQLDLHCQADWFAVGQVFRNILENSLNACTDPVEIEAAWSETELAGRPALRVALRDNGPGLTPEQKKKIFEPFYTTKSHGTGLGMAIAKNVVEAHKGQIAIGAGNGRGTEIVITIPRER